MNGLELNKIISAVLLASLIGMVVGKVADVLYKPERTVKARGYQVALSDTPIAVLSNDKAAFAPDIAELMSKASSAAGKIAFKKCAVCHTDDKGGSDRIGPNLWNIVGAKKAAKDNFKYSAAMTSLGGVWGYEELFHFLHSPAKFVSGTKMSFAGLSKPEDIANVIAYLREEASDNALPLPAQ